jgi:hypothetical protein
MAPALTRSPPRPGPPLARHAGVRDHAISGITDFCRVIIQSKLRQHRFSMITDDLECSLNSGIMGRSVITETCPGRSRAPPVITETCPGRSRAPPVITETCPGRSRPPPVITETYPCQSRPPPVITETYPGRSRPPPVITETYPCQSRPPPVITETCPGRSRPPPVITVTCRATGFGGRRPAAGHRSELGRSEEFRLFRHFPGLSQPRRVASATRYRRSIVVNDVRQRCPLRSWPRHRQDPPPGPSHRPDRGRTGQQWICDVPVQPRRRNTRPSTGKSLRR